MDDGHTKGELSIEGGFKSSGHYDFVLCLKIEVVNDDGYVFRSSKKQYEKCVLVILSKC